MVLEERRWRGYILGMAISVCGLTLELDEPEDLLPERGAGVSRRHRDIMVDFYRNGHFHPESNLLFGEGGAGTGAAASAAEGKTSVDPSRD